MIARPLQVRNESGPLDSLSGLELVVILFLAFVVKPKTNGLNQTHQTVVEGEQVGTRRTSRHFYHR